MARLPEHSDRSVLRRRLSAGTALAGALLIAASATVGYAQAETSESVLAFIAETRDYANMHRRLERQVGDIEISMSADHINRLIQQLAAAIRAERPAAAQGDLFRPALAHELRARVNDALAAHDFTPADVIAESRVEGVDYARVSLRVNGTFPWALGTTMFPCVIKALPTLPPELQYRIVGTDLVLIDVHASMIVDILPSLLGAETER